MHLVLKLLLYVNLGCCLIKMLDVLAVHGGITPILYDILLVIVLGYHHFSIASLYLSILKISHILSLQAIAIPIFRAHVHMYRPLLMYITIYCSWDGNAPFLALICHTIESPGGRYRSD